MSNGTDQGLSVRDMILSFSLFGFVSLVCIFIWKRSEFGSFLFEIFHPSNFVLGSVIGIVSGVLLAILVGVIAKVTKTKIPEDKNNALLVDLMKKPSGPIVIGVLPGLFEELFFRGFLLSLFLSFFNPTAAIIFSTLVFWLVHVPQYKTSIVLNSVVIVLSLILSILFIEFGTLWAAIFAHGVYNYLITVFVQKGIINLY